MSQFVIICGILAMLMGFVGANPVLYDFVEDVPEKSRVKRSFSDLGCRGTYNASIFSKVDQICEDCYEIFKEPKIHSLCREDCFASDYFKGCIDILKLTDQTEEILKWVQSLHGLIVSELNASFLTWSHNTSTPEHFIVFQ